MCNFSKENEFIKKDLLEIRFIFYCFKVCFFSINILCRRVLHASYAPRKSATETSFRACMQAALTPSKGLVVFSFKGNFHFKEEKKIHWDKVGVVRRLRNRYDTFFCQILGNHEGSVRYRVEVWDSEWITSFLSKNTIGIAFIVDLNLVTFFCREDCGVCHSLIYCLVSGSYSKNQLSSPVMTLLKIWGTSPMRSNRFFETASQFYFCWSVKILSLYILFLQTSTSHMTLPPTKPADDCRVECFRGQCPYCRL